MSPSERAYRGLARKEAVHLDKEAELTAVELINTNAEVSAEVCPLAFRLPRVPNLNFCFGSFL
jgi:hypothetical protein